MPAMTTTRREQEIETQRERVCCGFQMQHNARVVWTSSGNRHKQRVIGIPNFASWDSIRGARGASGYVAKASLLCVKLSVFTSSSAPNVQRTSTQVRRYVLPGQVVRTCLWVSDDLMAGEDYRRTHASSSSHARFVRGYVR